MSKKCIMQERVEVKLENLKFELDKAVFEKDMKTKTVDHLEASIMLLEEPLSSVEPIE